MKSIVFAAAALFGFSSLCFSAEPKSTQTTGDEFSVQILLSGKQLKPENKKFKGVADIHEEVCDGLFKYKYTTGGQVKTFAEAAALRVKMIDAGFSDAFVVRYRDGQRMVPNGLAKAKNTKPATVPLATKPAPVEPKVAAQPAEPKTKPGVGSSVAQTRPEFKGGEDNLESFIRNNLHYPNPPMDKNKSAQVFLNFTVDNTGKIKNPQVVAGLNEELNTEALRLIGIMPEWNPGTLGGKPANMECFLPIDFHEPVEKQVAQSGDKK